MDPLITRLFESKPGTEVIIRAGFGEPCVTIDTREILIRVLPEKLWALTSHGVELGIKDANGVDITGIIRDVYIYSPAIEKLQKMRLWDEE